MGRDDTTDSRQVVKIDQPGLIARRVSPADRRVNDAIPTNEGRKAIETLDAARERMAAPITEKWGDEDFADLTRPMRRFVDDLMEVPHRPTEKFL